MTAGGAVPGTWSPPAARRVPPGLGGTCSPQKNRRLLHRRFSSPREASLMWGVRRGSGVAGGAGCLRVNRASGRGREVYAETSASAAKAAHGRSPWKWRSRRSRASQGRRIRRPGERPPLRPLSCGRGREPREVTSGLRAAVSGGCQRAPRPRPARYPAGAGRRRDAATAGQWSGVHAREPLEEHNPDEREHNAGASVREW